METKFTDWESVAHIMCGALMPLIGPEKAQQFLAEAVERRTTESAPDLLAAIRKTKGTA